MNQRPHVGDLVYRFGSPAMCGKVVAVLGPEGELSAEEKQLELETRDDVGAEALKFMPRGIARVRVRRLGKKKDMIMSQLGLRDFRLLVEEHRRKLETHSATMARLEAL